MLAGRPPNELRDGSRALGPLTTHARRTESGVRRVTAGVRARRLVNGERLPLAAHRRTVAIRSGVSMRRCAFAFRWQRRVGFLPTVAT